ADRVERVGDFSTEALSDRYGHVRFERGEGRYAFDDGAEEWYKKSVKTDRFYKPFAKNYVAPWKLVPVGESDVVTARYDGRKDIDLRKVRFVSEPNAAALPAQGQKERGEDGQPHGLRRRKGTGRLPVEHHGQSGSVHGARRWRAAQAHSTWSCTCSWRADPSEGV
ncbi:MAG: hypothetical protein IJU72_10735, partial [Bacteroidales bacterium]|nr:hypothetical protein [Bacteroidales bacterium]